MLKSLLPDQGSEIKRQMRPREELLALSGYAAHPRDFEDVMRILDTELRLVTPTDPEGVESEERRVESSPHAEREDYSRYYQLTHDYLVPALRQWLTRKQRETMRGRAESRLAEAAAIWSARPQTRQLPSWWEWVDILVFTRRRQWTSPEKTMMRKATLYHAVLTSVVLAALILAAPTALNQMALALARLDHAGQVNQRYNRLLTAPPDEFRSIRETLKNERDIPPRLWNILEDPVPDTGQQLRAAAALAFFDPKNEAWSKTAPALAHKLATTDPLLVGQWKDELQPVSGALVRPLFEIFVKRPPEQRGQIAKLLADYAAEDAKILADLVQQADQDEYAIFFPKLDTYRDEAVLLLKQTLLQPVSGPLILKEQLASQQAQAAITLARMGHPEEVWPLLSHESDLNRRSYLVNRLGPLGAPADVVVAQLESEKKDIGVRHALILSLGGFNGEQLPPAQASLSPTSYCAGMAKIPTRGFIPPSIGSCDRTRKARRRESWIGGCARPWSR